jgi:hypothetical protein
MTDRSISFSEILVGSLAQIIRQIAQGVADAQSALDTAAVQSQKTLDEKLPELASIGYQVTWYQIPTVEAELKVAVHFERTGEQSSNRVGVFLSPFNAKYQSAFSFAAEGASTVKLRIVPITPPIPLSAP